MSAPMSAQCRLQCRLNVDSMLTEKVVEIRWELVRLAWFLDQNLGLGVIYGTVPSEFDYRIDFISKIIKISAYIESQTTCFAATNRVFWRNFGQNLVKFCPFEVIYRPKFRSRCDLWHCTLGIWLSQPIHAKNRQNVCANCIQKICSQFFVF